jgi:uncharacterized protein (DUF4415 family)
MSERNIVKFKLDPNNLGAQTSQQRKRLQQIAAMPDEQIDYSDIANSANVVRWTRPDALVSTENKQQVTLRLDADVLNFFKTTGKKYQSRINAALREYMKTHS